MIPNEEMKKIYAIGITMCILLTIGVFGALFVLKPTSSPDSEKKVQMPFPLADFQSTYIISERSPEIFVLSYTSPQGVTQEIYVDSTSIQPFKVYLDQPIKVEGYLKTQYKNVQCIKAPCDPVATDIFVITKLSPVTP